jgi:hypothetical protein
MMAGSRAFPVSAYCRWMKGPEVLANTTVNRPPPPTRFRRLLDACRRGFKDRNKAGWAQGDAPSGARSVPSVSAALAAGSDLERGIEPNVAATASFFARVRPCGYHG